MLDLFQGFNENNANTKTISRTKFCFLTLFTSATLIASSCGSTPKAQSSEVKLTSTKGIAYTATLSGVQIKDDLSDWLGDADAATIQAFLEGPQGDGLRKAKAMMQIYFAVGTLRQTGEGSLNIGQLEFKELQLGEKLAFSATYNATITLFAKEGQADLKKDLWIPIKVDKKSLRSLVDTNPKCFSNELEHARRDHQDDYESVAFYYFNESLSGCDQNLKTNGTLQKVEFSLVRSPENPSEEKYPEYKKIWSDNRLVATLFFTPADRLSKSDPGVQAAEIFARGLISNYGKPTSGDLTPPSAGYSEPIKPYDQEASFKLPDGRILVTKIQVRDSEWLRGDSSAQEEIRAAAKSSDFVSYNGHSGYGFNIESFEKSVTPAKDQHLVFFANGCSSFAYVGRQIFRGNDAGNSIPKDLDLVANLNSTYFHLFGQTNLMFINNLVEAKSSYSSILHDIQKMQGEQYDASLIIRGEEDNAKP